ncbi:hypothetical protein CpipJ_CPIJ019223 [Culex quinquefasciatus]|uniref:Uncharacterized protein n=1 Tax=Culex quinquefasciatus TaxID=7176 RepID=B0XIF1_CULQU|nr:hypothetical protein CpipJ_CPIJ019223 [Culex quinquefasciatus]|eukprot:XP_001869423.1 hypothetical protein CpipJ_CPIJ019223 [Culex quinquefasciatus]
MVNHCRNTHKTVRQSSNLLLSWSPVEVPSWTRKKAKKNLIQPLLEGMPLTQSHTRPAETRWPRPRRRRHDYNLDFAALRDFFVALSAPRRPPKPGPTESARPLKVVPCPKFRINPDRGVPHKSAMKSSQKIDISNLTQSVARRPGLAPNVFRCAPLLVESRCCGTLRAAGDHQPTVRPARFRVRTLGFAAKVGRTPEVLEKLRVEMSHG